MEKTITFSSIVVGLSCCDDDFSFCNLGFRTYNFRTIPEWTVGHFWLPQITPQVAMRVI